MQISRDFWDFFFHKKLNWPWKKVGSCACLSRQLSHFNQMLAQDEDGGEEGNDNTKNGKV